MLFNFSNHPISAWSSTQMNEAMKQWGGVIDVPFPFVDPAVDSDAIHALASEWAIFFNHIFAQYPGQQNAIHIMGEHTLCVALVNILKANGIECVASTTARNTVDKSDGEKISRFQFARFRKY